MKKLTVGQRITLGFAVILQIMGVIVVIGYLKIGTISSLSNLVQTNTKEDAFITQKEVDHLNWTNNLVESIQDNKEISVQMDPHKCSFGQWLYSILTDKTLQAKYPKEVIEKLKIIEPLHYELHQSAKYIQENHSIFDTNILQTLHKSWENHLVWMKSLQLYLLSDIPFKGGLSHKECAFGKWFYETQFQDTKLYKILQKIEIPHEQLHDSANEIISLINSGHKEKAISYFNKITIKNIEQLSSYFSEAFEYLENEHSKAEKMNKIFLTQTKPTLHQVQEHLHELRVILKNYLISSAGEAANDLAGTTLFAKVFILCAGIIAVIIGILLSIIIAKSITRPIIKITDYLSNSSTQVAEASKELSSAGQTLSSVASEQASSLEETSSSVEEITGTVQSNVENAQHCVRLSSSVVEQAKTGIIEMEKLIQSMNNILVSNEKIQNLSGLIAKIADKTAIIDDIVFQTKLLSFNASVEAERAGEHGRGFAVVAQEVGNLAQMSGKAATEISTIVTKSIAEAENITGENKIKVEDGYTIAKKMAVILNAINESSNTVLDNINSIASASKDQSNGIAQINKAISQLDKATQENAATAEEAASSSEELNGQAAQLRDQVHELFILVKGVKHIAKQNSVNATEVKTNIQFFQNITEIVKKAV